MTKGNARGDLYSALAIPPGETLSDEIAARGISRTELAARLGRPVQVVNEIVHGKKAITDHTAIGLEKVLGILAAFWVNLEQNYQMTKARLRVAPDRRVRFARRVMESGRLQEHGDA